MRIDHLHRFVAGTGAARTDHQAVVDRQQEFTGDRKGRRQQQVERASDRALGRVLDRDHAVMRAARLDLAEDFVEGRAGTPLDQGTELAYHRFLAVGAGGTEVGDRERRFDGTAGAHDLDEDLAQRTGGQRPGIGGRQAVEHLCLAVGPVDRSGTLEVPDLAGDARPLVEQAEQLGVDGVDTATQRKQCHRHLRHRGRSRRHCSGLCRAFAAGRAHRNLDPVLDFKSYRPES